MTVQDNHVTMIVDGSIILEWQGKPEQLSLGDYDGRYRFYRVSIAEILIED